MAFPLATRKFMEQNSYMSKRTVLNYMTSPVQIRKTYGIGSTATPCTKTSWDCALGWRKLNVFCTPSSQRCIPPVWTVPHDPAWNRGVGYVLLHPQPGNWAPSWLFSTRERERDERDIIRNNLILRGGWAVLTSRLVCRQPLYLSSHTILESTKSSRARVTRHC
jgi:hypothetical protein